MRSGHYTDNVLGDNKLRGKALGGNRTKDSTPNGITIRGKGGEARDGNRFRLEETGLSEAKRYEKIQQGTRIFRIKGRPKFSETKLSETIVTERMLY